MIQFTHALCRTGSTGLCTCLVASTLVLAPPLAAPPPTRVAPAVGLTASTSTFPVTVPELLGHVGEFTELVQPLAPELPAQPPGEDGQIAAAAVSSLAITTPIATVVGTVGSFVLRAVVGVLAPFVRIPGLEQVVGGAILLTTFIGGGAVAVVTSLIAEFERAVGAVIGGILGLPAALLGGAAGASAAATDLAQRAEIAPTGPTPDPPVADSGEYRKLRQSVPPSPSIPETVGEDLPEETTETTEISELSELSEATDLDPVDSGEPAGAERLEDVLADEETGTSERTPWQPPPPDDAHGSVPDVDPQPATTPSAGDETDGGEALPGDEP